MLTVGFGDISPASNLEKSLSVFTMFISCGVFGYTLNKIGNLVLLIK